MHRRTVAQILASLTTVTLGAALMAGPAGASEQPAPAGADAAVQAGVDAGSAQLTRYREQSLRWHGCDDPYLDGAGASCADVTVPLDYRRPAGRTITVALSRIRATDPARRRGVLFINPGGPGSPAREQVLLGQLVPDLAAHYDLIGLDPRFVGASTPLTCRWSTDTPLRSAGPDRASFAESVAFARTLAAGCADADPPAAAPPGRGRPAAARDLLPFATTENTARDMDVVRAALREPRLSYLGVSYGTYLGAVYLQLFGAHADRVVLDSAVDPGLAGPGLFTVQGPALAAALDHWAAFAASRDRTYHLGTTTRAVVATVTHLAESAARHPIAVGRFHLDEHVVPYVVYAHLGADDPDSYAALAEDVRSLDSGTAPDEELTEFLEGVFTGSGAATDRAGTPILCADRAVSRHPRTYLRDIEAHRSSEPLFGPLTRNVTPCAFWPVRASRPVTIRNSAPALLVGASGDPYTPAAGQRAMHDALAGSRLITVRGAYRHVVFLTDDCVDAAIVGYLDGGPLPAGDATC